jgi:hypothetical protein
MNLKTTLFAASCLSTLCMLTGVARAERFIDTFEADLPLQTLPGAASSAPQLWAGTLGGVARAVDVAAQTSLAGVFGGRRETSVEASDMANNVILTSGGSNGQSYLNYAAGPGLSGRMILEYGASAQMNANLIADGSVALEFEIEGDMDNSNPVRPVALTVTIESGGGSVIKSTSVQIIADGLYQIPFSSFPGVNFADVDYIGFEFNSSTQWGVDYDLVGGIRTTRSFCSKADIALDTFGDALPLRNLPGSGSYPIMWVGTFNGTSVPSDTAIQTGLFGAIAGQRKTKMVASDLSNFVTASMSSTNGTPTLAYASGNPTSGTLTLDYGSQSALNANLSSAKAFELEIKGDLNSGGSPRPVPLTVTVVSGPITRATTVTLLNNGMYYIPFTSFPSVNWADVDRVMFHFNASQVQAVDYDLIGGLRAAACTP